MTMKWKVQDPRHLTVSEHADRMSAYALATRFAIGLTLSCEPIDHVKLWEPDGRAFYISATAAYPRPQADVPLQTDESRTLLDEHDEGWRLLQPPEGAAA